MRTKKGIPVSPGIAIARAFVVDAADQPIPRRSVPESAVPGEVARLEHALASSCEAIEREREVVEQRVGKEVAGIFNWHLGMLRDKTLRERFEKMIREEKVTAEYGVFSVMRQYARDLREIGEARWRERDTDIWDLEKRVLGQLIGETRQELEHLDHEAILVAYDLTPSQTAALDKTKIKGIATDAGGRTSHTAILAHALGIPAVVGLGNITSQVSTGAMMILDGQHGAAIIKPHAEHLMEYRQRLERIEAFELRLGESAKLPAVTRDGTEIVIGANIEFPGEIAMALEKGATEIGLYRTEFLFLASPTAPTEDEQFEAYREAIRALDGRMLTIRTLDLGADKVVGFIAPGRPEANPFLGCRSIRLCLQNLPLFETQLRAILRASVEGPVRIMFPLISNVMELRQAKMILSEVRDDLSESGTPFREDIQVGIMIEVPSAALQARTLAREVDFFSIGTNDLIQYTLAVDRANVRIANLYTAAHPAIYMLVRDVVRAANRHKIDVSLCGEMAGEPEFTLLLLGLGLRKMSMTPPAIPEIKRIISKVTIDKCRRVARKVGTFDSDREIINYLREETSRILPEVYDGRSVAS